jgi:(p)ppGpp synthase/HD superfamily hydrolase
MPTIDETTEFIQLAHAGQTDKAGREYYLHPIAVMKRLPENTDIEVKLAALLHDVLEDTSFTRHDLSAMSYTDRTLNAVEQVTQQPNDTRTYAKKIDALIASGNKDAIQVKFADMCENTDPERLGALPSDVRRRLEQKYSGPTLALQFALLGLSE